MEYERSEARRVIGEQLERMPPGASMEVVGRIFEMAFGVCGMMPNTVAGAAVEYLDPSGNYRLTKPL